MCSGCPLSLVEVGEVALGGAGGHAPMVDGGLVQPCVD